MRAPLNLRLLSTLGPPPINPCACTPAQEERLLRTWLNSLDPARLHLSSLFEPAMATGWPLLLALEALQPGCVAWAQAYAPPFKEKVGGRLRGGPRGGRCGGEQGA